MYWGVIGCRFYSTGGQTGGQAALEGDRDSVGWRCQATQFIANWTYILLTVC